MAEKENIRVFAKGAPEVVLPCCELGLTGFGLEGELKADEILSQMKDEMSSKGLRVIAFSYRDLKVEEYKKMRDDENFEKLIFEKHTFQAIVALEDPLRERASKFISFAKKGKITVRMITGDNFDTAKKVALDCGILADGEQNDSKSAMEAKNFREKIGFEPDGI
jgi:magnesium-transporting ATPase (P-type)